MALAELFNKVTQLSALKKIYISLALIVSLLLSLTFYLNYEALKNQKIKVAHKQEESLNLAMVISNFTS